MERSRTNLVLLAAAIGGTSALFHLVHHEILIIEHKDGFLNPTVHLAIGQGLLYAVPLFLGVLSGLWSNKPIRTALQVSGVALLTAAPLMLQDSICLVVILPFCLLVAPLTSWLTWRWAGPGRRPPGGGGAAQSALLLALPLCWALGERAFPGPAGEPVELVDRVEVAVPRQELWQSLEYLELRFTQPPPALVRWFLPVPRAVHGGGSQVGAERRVLFSTGSALGTIVASEPPTRLRFRVELAGGQASFFDHWVTLEDSELELEVAGAGRTILTHRTRYRPLAQPRWYFEPVEQFLGSYVQRYMLRAYAESLAGPVQSLEERIVAAR